MSFPAYPKYKDSGVEWLGKVPEHWASSKLGFESWVRARLGWKGLKADEYVDDGYVLLSTPDIKKREINFADVNFITRERYDESPEIKLKEGDVLLAKDGSTLGTVNIVRTLLRPSTVNSSLAVISPHKRLDGVFLFYIFQSSSMEHVIQQSKGGMGVPHIFQEDINKFRIVLPTISEQRTIAAFLDHETSKIDALIDEQERLIELLKEKRQAVISHVVTKGLNPNAKMKVSGVEWLGEVPEHWDVCRIKHIALRISKGTTPTTIGAGFCDSGIRFFKAENISAGETVPVPEFFISADAHEQLSRSALCDGDVLVVIAGATTGKSAVVNESFLPANTNQAVAFVRPKARSNSKYISTWLSIQQIQQQVLLSAVQSAQPNLSMEDLGNLPIAIPPEKALKDLMEMLATTIAPLNELLSLSHQAIELLQERRSALISAAVTGQIDVRVVS